MSEMATVTAELEYEGQRYTVTQEYPADYEEGGIYYHWTDGNYGCDCNRLLFIAEAYDDYPGEENADGGFPCGEAVKLVGLSLDGKDLLAPTTHERLAAIGLVGAGGKTP